MLGTPLWPQNPYPIFKRHERRNKKMSVKSQLWEVEHTTPHSDRVCPSAQFTFPRFP